MHTFQQTYKIPFVHFCVILKRNLHSISVKVLLRLVGQLRTSVGVDQLFDMNDYGSYKTSRCFLLAQENKADIQYLVNLS